MDIDRDEFVAKLNAVADGCVIYMFYWDCLATRAGLDAYVKRLYENAAKANFVAYYSRLSLFGIGCIAEKRKDQILPSLEKMIKNDDEFCIGVSNVTNGGLSDYLDLEAWCNKEKEKNEKMRMFNYKGSEI